MSTSLREAMSAAGAEPGPPSHVDIEAALLTGRRRRDRRQIAAAGAGTLVVAAVVLASSMARTAGPAGPPQGGTSTYSTLEPRDCAPLDEQAAAIARDVLRPPAGVWSAPRTSGQGCLPGKRPVGHFLIEVSGPGNRTGEVSARFSANSAGSVGRPPCEPGEGDRCQVRPEGTLRLTVGDVPPHHWAGATLDVRGGLLIELSAGNCLTSEPGLPRAQPCLDASPYTAEQLGEVTVAIARAR